MALDITEIVSLCGAEKVLVLEDQFDYCQTLFYCTTLDENKETITDYAVKYLYLAFPALASLHQFLLKPSNFPDDFHINTESEGFKDVTK